MKRLDPLADAAGLLERIEAHECWQPQALQGTMSLRLVELSADVVRRAGGEITREHGELETLELIADALAALWARLETGSLPEPAFSPERIVA